MAIAVLAACGGDDVAAPGTTTTNAAPNATTTTTTTIATTTTATIAPTTTIGATVELIELVVGPELAECVGVDVRTCLVVMRPDSTEWEFFYSAIEGFEHVEGVTSTLLVERTVVPEPEADGSSYDYRLVEVLDVQPESG